MAGRGSRSSAARPAGARALHWLAGTWRTDGYLVGVPAGPRATLVAIDRYEWVPGAAVLAHYVAGHLGRTSVASFEAWTYDRRRRLYVSTSFDERGETSSFEARLRGREWTVQGAEQRFRGTFAADGQALSGTWDQKAGRGWKPWLAITLRRAGD